MPRAAPSAASQNVPGPGPEPLHELVGAVGAQHVEGAVGEVEHAQHAEDEGEPGGDEEQEHRGGEAAQRLGEDERGSGIERGQQRLTWPVRLDGRERGAPSAHAVVRRRGTEGARAVAGER